MNAQINSVCGICIEPFNRVRKLVKCKCEYECCIVCTKQYMLSGHEDAHCMNCKIGWDRNFLINNFDLKFINNQYKKHREDILIEREMLLMPGTQIHVEREIKLEELNKRKKEIKQQITELKKENDIIEKEIFNMRYSNEKKQEKSQFIRKCPNGDCRGFLSQNLKCGICNIWACGECREVKGSSKDSEHTCDQEILESVKMLEKETRNCPKCSYRIYKTEGCSQMYCSPEFGGCGTAFCWNTGKIEVEIHNPHYFDYLRKINNGHVERNPNDVICGRELNNHFITSLSRKNGVTAKLLDITRNVKHIKYVNLPKYNPRDRNNGNLDLRITYMRQKISKDDMKKLVQRREKDNMKKREITNLLTMFINSMIDILYRYYYDQEPNINTYIKEIQSLRFYTNECFETISKTYKSNELYLCEKFSLKAN